MSSAPRLLYLVTEDWYFCSHRLPLARAAREAGYQVTVATRVRQHGEQIRAAGLDLVPLRLSRRSTNPLREFGALREIAGIYRRVQPDIAHHVALKPVLYGSLAAGWAGTPHVVNALAGLGYVFSSADRRARLLRPLVEGGYRLLLNRANSRLIVQNPDDLAHLTAHAVVDPQRVVLIAGSGVDLARFQPAPQPEGVPLAVLPSRMLRDKGVVEFVEAARQLRGEGVAARFALVGDCDPENPASIAEDRLRAWRDEGIVEWWGWNEDMVSVYRQASLVCLPSYREGLPIALVEAAACERAIVTCDVPGCREVVRHGDNGLLVAPREVQPLAVALRTLIEDPARRAAMGRRGRQRAAAEFSLDRVIADTLALYRACLADTHAPNYASDKSG